MDFEYSCVHIVIQICHLLLILWKISNCIYSFNIKWDVSLSKVILLVGF